MSKSAQYEYRMAQKRKEALRRQMVKEEVLRRLDRLKEVYQIMQEKAYGKVIPKEMDQLQKNFEKLNEQLEKGQVDQAKDLTDVLLNDIEVNQYKASSLLAKNEKERQAFAQKAKARTKEEERIKREIIELEHQANRLKETYNLSFSKEILMIKEAEKEASFLSQEIKALRKKMDEKELAILERKEVVRSIYQTLKRLDFEVEAPHLVTLNGEEKVKLIAKRPSGKRAQCLVGTKGDVIYKFDEYEGMTCLKDIETFNATLKEAYAIQLSDERLLWENPIREKNEAKVIKGDHYLGATRD